MTNAAYTTWFISNARNEGDAAADGGFPCEPPACYKGAQRAAWVDGWAAYWL